MVRPVRALKGDSRITPARVGSDKQRCLARPMMNL